VRDQLPIMQEEGLIDVDNTGGIDGWHPASGCALVTGAPSWSSSDDVEMTQAARVALV